MKDCPRVVWPFRDGDNVRQGDKLMIIGEVLPYGKVMMTAKVIPGNTASNVHRFQADADGTFSEEIEIPKAPAEANATALIVVTAFGYEQTNSYSYHYLG